MGVNSLPKTVTRQRRGCDMNPGPPVKVYSQVKIALSSGAAGGPTETGMAATAQRPTPRRRLQSITAVCKNTVDTSVCR